MVLTVYTVTYASCGGSDNELYTETQTFINNEDKAREYHQQAIYDILENHNSEHLYESYKDLNDFAFEDGGWQYSCKLSVQDYDVYLQIV
jgi:hypothetical protein